MKLTMLLMVVLLFGCARFAGAQRSCAPLKLPSDALTDAPEPLREVRAGKAGPTGVRWRLANGKGIVLDSGDQVEGIPVGDKADFLCFLQGFRPGPELENWKLNCAIAHRNCTPLPEPPVLYRCYVRYADGREEEIRMRWGEAVHNWHRVGAVPEMLWARPAWRQEVVGDQSAEKTVLYAMEWPNPRPNVEIESLTLISASKRYRRWGTAAVLGITACRDSARGARYYVAPPPLGDDANPGNFDEPWGTPHRALEALEPGDTVYLRGGVYPLTEHLVLPRSGREEAPITWSAYPGESPRLDASTIFLNPANQSTSGPGGGPYGHDDGAIQMAGLEHIRLRGLRVDNARMHGIKVGSSHNIELAHNTTYRAVNCGIAIYGSRDDFSRNIRLIGDRVVRAGWTEAVDDSAGRYVKVFKGPREAFDIYATEGCEAAFNHVSGSYKEGFDPLGTNVDLHLHHNYIHHTWGNGIYNDSRGGARGAEYAYNILHDCQGGIGINAEARGGAIRDYSIHHNITYDNWGTGIAVYGPDTSDIEVFNNTSCSNGYRFSKKRAGVGGIVVRGDGVSDCRVRDNLAADNRMVQVGMVDADPAEQNLQFRHNVIPPGQEQPTYQPPRHEASVPADGLITEEFPGFVDAESDYYRPRGPVDAGAIPFEMPLPQGHGFDGTVLASFDAGWHFRPVQIPEECLNARIHHMANRGSWFNPPGHHKHNWDPLGLPTGRAALGGVEWNILDWHELDNPTICMLDGYLSTVDETEIRGITVGRRAQALFFLHTYQRGPAIVEWEEARGQALLNNEPLPEAPEPFHYVVNYADGTSREVPVVWSRHIESWTRTPNGFPTGKLANKGFGQMVEAWHRYPADFAPPADARVAWSEPGFRLYFGDRPRRPVCVVIYRMRWDNPEPDKQIEDLAIVSANDAEHDWGAPAVLAITTGSRTKAVRNPSP